MAGLRTTRGNTTGPAVKQLQGLKQLRAAAGAAAGVKATLTLVDGAGTPLNTLSVTAIHPGEHGNTYHLKTLRTTGPADGSFFDLDVFAADDVTLLESWKSLSMVNASPNFVETRINGKSNRIVVADLNSATTDQRPADKAVGTANLVSGAGEFTVTGIKRGDIIVSAINVTDAALPAIPDGDIIAVDTDKAVIKVGGGTTAAKALMLMIWPAS